MVWVVVSCQLHHSLGLSPRWTAFSTRQSGWSPGGQGWPLDLASLDEYSTTTSQPCHHHHHHPGFLFPWFPPPLPTQPPHVLVVWNMRCSFSIPGWSGSGAGRWRGVGKGVHWCMPQSLAGNNGMHWKLKVSSQCRGATIHNGMFGVPKCKWKWSGQSCCWGQPHEHWQAQQIRNLLSQKPVKGLCGCEGIQGLQKDK